MECEDCKKRFHATCSELGNEALEKNELGIDTWYCTDCKADCGLCSRVVLNGHKAVQCDSCEMRLHNECSYISLGEYETLENTNCTWICPKCEVLNFSDPYFDTQCNFEQSNRFNPLVKGMNKASSAPGTNKTTSLKGLKFVSLNIMAKRGKKLELLAFLDYHKPDIVGIQETKHYSSISTSELFPDSCPYNAYRKDRNLNGGGVMLLIHKEIPHMPLTELETTQCGLMSLQTKLLTT